MILKPESNSLARGERDGCKYVVWQHAWDERSSSDAGPDIPFSVCDITMT